MLKHRELTEGRIAQTGRRILDQIYREGTPMTASFFESTEPVPWTDAVNQSFRPIDIGEPWGENFSCAWFQISGKVPQTAAGEEVVALIDLDGEACLYDRSGKPVQGLTPKFDDRHGGMLGPKREVKLFSPARGGENVHLMLDAGANHLWRSTGRSRIRQLELAVFNPLAWRLYHEYRFLELLMLDLPLDRHRQLILRALNNACNLLGNYQDQDLHNARGAIIGELSKTANSSALAVSAIGHAHIDVAWLWPLRETVRKTARTFSTALRMMDEYPSYKFGSSQPQLYQMMKDHHPALYREIQRAVKRGRWEVQGGMWVESDTNIPSGESLVRQILLGKRFFRKEFNVDVTNLWLPDVFGYSAALPQILKKSGINYFTTHKLNWNQFNRFPHHTMHWKGLDGSSVLAHFMAGNDYNAPCTPASFMDYARKNQDNDRSDHALCLFGIGDGGGGPGRTHLEWLHLAKNIEDLPRVTPEFAAEFFKKAQKNARDLLTWEGELYFEYHRGTYTTQARVKQRNRQLEYLVRDVELAYAMLPLSIYPTKELRHVWQILLCNQFHDIIPGSSITRVYKETHEEYDAIERILRELLNSADQRFVAQLQIPATEGAFLIRNSLSWTRRSLVLLPGDHHDQYGWRTSTGTDLATQEVAGGVLVDVETPALGHLLIERCPSMTNPRTALKISTRTLQNSLLKVEFTANGLIKRIYDKVMERDVLAEGCLANEFCLYEDLPLAYEAWDIDAFYMEKTPAHPRFCGTKVLEAGPLRATLEQTWQAPNYQIKQTVSLSHNSRLITFDTVVDWREDQHMLRVRFPVNVHADQATYEIQFGHIRRPTHMNTSWDMARFEVIAHRWADISQPNYGVTLVNDSKYGHQILGNVMSLNLLRSPRSPDPEADRHQHHFRYGLLPHPGDLAQGNSIHTAHEFNLAPRVIQPVETSSQHRRTAQPTPSFLTRSRDNIIIDTIKKAEDKQALIVRFYEAFGIDCLCRVHFADRVDSICLVNLMEEEESPAALIENSVELTFKPFEIVTIKVVLTRKTY